MREELRRAAGDFKADLKRFSPGFAELFGDVADVDTKQEASDPFYDGLAHLLGQLAASAGGAVLVIDDAQWLDTASQNVLQRLAMSLEELPLLIVAALSDDVDDPAATNPLTREFGAAVRRRVTFEPLGQRGVETLASEHLGGRAPSPELLDRIYAISRGNAYAVGEYLRAMIEEGALRPVWGEWVVIGDKLDEVDLPEQVNDLLIGRLDKLSSESSDVLAWLAVAGTALEPSVLAACHGADEADVYDALSEATRAQLLTSDAQGRRRLIHATVRQALLSGAKWPARLPRRSRRLSQ